MNCPRFNRSEYSFVPISEFNQLTRAGAFSEGPWIENFGSGYGEPYNPHRDVWGTLADGRKVYSVTGMEGCPYQESGGDRA